MNFGLDLQGIAPKMFYNMKTFTLVLWFKVVVHFDLLYDPCSANR